MENKIEISSNKLAQNALEIVARHNGEVISAGSITPFYKNYNFSNLSFSYFISSKGKMINELDEYNLSSKVLHSKIIKDVKKYINQTEKPLKIIDKSYQHIRDRNLKKSDLKRFEKSKLSPKSLK
jgi:hypothetical protein